jgi:hypothetical protein
MDAGVEKEAAVLDASLIDSGVGADSMVECEPQDLEFTGEPQAIVVPPNAVFLHIKAWGAGGNSDCVDNGGAGGYTEAVYTVTGQPELVAIVGQLGHNVGEEAFGFAAAGAGGLTGVFVGPAPITENDQDKALVIAGGGGSAMRDECTPEARGGPGNVPTSPEHMPTMKGGEATHTGPNGRNENTGGGGGYKGGRGRTAADEAGMGGSGFVASQKDGLQIHQVNGVYQSIIEHFDPAQGGPSLPPHQDDPDYIAHSGDCDPGTSECNGLLIVRFLCEDPGPIVE